MNVEKHILYLLQFHECVIIPEFGGFISNYIPAAFDQTKNTFFPPTKKVVFNDKINRNDGLLIDRIVESEEIGYQEAYNLIITFVDQLNQALNRGEKIKYEKLGTFELDQKGALIFQANSNFNLTEAYGLSEFSYPTINDKLNISTFTPRPAVRALNNRKDILKIAASIALLLALSVFPIKSEKLIMQSSNLNPMLILNSDYTETDTKTISSETETEKVVVDEVILAEKINPYILVGGSFQNINNANKLQTILLNKGFNPQIVKIENGFYRVIIESYDNKTEAFNALKLYRLNNANSDVWVSIQ